MHVLIFASSKLKIALGNWVHSIIFLFFVGSWRFVCRFLCYVALYNLLIFILALAYKEFFLNLIVSFGSIWVKIRTGWRSRTCAIPVTIVSNNSWCFKCALEALWIVGNSHVLGHWSSLFSLRWLSESLIFFVSTWQASWANHTWKLVWSWSVLQICCDD